MICGFWLKIPFGMSLDFVRTKKRCNVLTQDM